MCCSVQQQIAHVRTIHTIPEVSPPLGYVVVVVVIVVVVAVIVLLTIATYAADGEGIKKVNVHDFFQVMVLE